MCKGHFYFGESLFFWLWILFGATLIQLLVLKCWCKIDQAGDNVGLLIRGLKRDEVQRGQVITVTVCL